MGRQRAPGLTDDVGVIDTLLITRLLRRENHVVRVFLQRVVRRAMEVGLRPVVVDGQTATDIKKLETSAKFMQLDVEAHRVLEGIFDGADRSDLAANMEVQQLEAVEHAEAAQSLHDLDQLVGGQSELGSVSA